MDVLKNDIHEKLIFLRDNCFEENDSQVMTFITSLRHLFGREKCYLVHKVHCDALKTLEGINLFSRKPCSISKKCVDPPVRRNKEAITTHVCAVHSINANKSINHVCRKCLRSHQSQEDEKFLNWLTEVPMSYVSLISIADVLCQPCINTDKLDSQDSTVAQSNHNSSNVIFNVPHGEDKSLQRCTMTAAVHASTQIYSELLTNDMSQEVSIPELKLYPLNNDHDSGDNGGHIAPLHVNGDIMEISTTRKGVTGNLELIDSSPRNNDHISGPGSETHRLCLSLSLSLPSATGVLTIDGVDHPYYCPAAASHDDSSVDVVESTTAANTIKRSRETEVHNESTKVFKKIRTPLEPQTHSFKPPSSSQDLADEVEISDIKESHLLVNNVEPRARKSKYRCVHNREKRSCKDCGDINSICIHNEIKHSCKNCKIKTVKKTNSAKEKKGLISTSREAMSTDPDAVFGANAVPICQKKEKVTEIICRNKHGQILCVHDRVKCRCKDCKLAATTSTTPRSISFTLNEGSTVNVNHGQKIITRPHLRNCIHNERTYRCEICRGRIAKKDKTVGKNSATDIIPRTSANVKGVGVHGKTNASAHTKHNSGGEDIRTEKKKCMHGRVKYFCKECRGKGICIHVLNKYCCKICKSVRRT